VLTRDHSFTSHFNGGCPEESLCGGGGLNVRRVAKSSDFRPIEGYISPTVQDRKSYMSLRLVIKWVTLNDLERCNVTNLVRSLGQA